MLIRKASQPQLRIDKTVYKIEDLQLFICRDALGWWQHKKTIQPFMFYDFLFD